MGHAKKGLFRDGWKTGFRKKREIRKNAMWQKWALREWLIFGLGKMGPKMGLKARLLPRGVGRVWSMAKSRYIGVVLWWLALTGQNLVKSSGRKSSSHFKNRQQSAAVRNQYSPKVLLLRSLFSLETVFSNTVFSA